MGKLMYNDIDYSGSEVVELTQADYDALPSSKYYDDVTYLIKDVYSPSSTKNMGLGECYSTTEKIIGCWTDGKPLYQKTIHIPSVVYDSDWHIVNHNISDLGTVVEVNGILRQPGYSYPIPAYRPQYNLGIVIEVNATEIHYMNNWIAASTDMDITIKYTKTTDVAGSGNWTPEGVPAHHYSTDEQIIGTWMGKTLYQKTITINNSAFDNDGYYQINLASLGIKNCFPDSAHSYYIFSTYERMFESIVQESNSDFATNNYLYLKGTRNRAIDTGYVTIQYTKTS